MKNKKLGILGALGLSIKKKNLIYAYNIVEIYGNQLLY